MYGVWCVTCDVWRVMCDVWCVMCDVWCVMCDVWCVMCDTQQISIYRATYIYSALALSGRWYLRECTVLRICGRLSIVLSCLCPTPTPTPTTTTHPTCVTKPCTYMICTIFCPSQPPSSMLSSAQYLLQPGMRLSVFWSVHIIPSRCPPCVGWGLYLHLEYIVRGVERDDDGMMCGQAFPDIYI